MGHALVTVDLNADVGESFGRWVLGDDAALMPSLTSANIACGFHAGDPLVIRRACSLAVGHGVRIGAQVGYRDLAGFGRRYIDCAHDELAADLTYQIGALAALAQSVGGRVAYVKPHGALYHAARTNPAHAAAIVEAVRGWSADLALVAMDGGALHQQALAAEIPWEAEGFADRAYTADGELVARDDPAALLLDEADVVAQAVTLAHQVDSICIHGDTPQAAALAGAVRTGLAEQNIQVDARPR